MTPIVHLLLIIVLVQAITLIIAVAGLFFALHNRIQIIHKFYRERNKYTKLV